MNYGIKLKELRAENNITQEQLANHLNIKRSSYNQFEQQYDIIPLYRLNDIANYFKVSIDYILELSDKKKYTNSKNEINEELSRQRLKEFRKTNKLTQQKLADTIKIDRTIISNFERGRNMLATPFLYDICKKYHLSADYLLGKIS